MEGRVQIALTNGVQALTIVAGILINDSMLKEFCAHMDDRFDSDAGQVAHRGESTAGRSR